MAAINTYGLFNLSDFLPKKPTEVEVKVLKEMFEASVDGEAYDADRWSQYFRPAGLAARTGDPNVAPRETASAKAAPVDDTPPFDTDETVSTNTVAETAPATNAGGAQDILAMIRARQQS